MVFALLGYGTVGRGVYEVAAHSEAVSIKYVLDVALHPELGNVSVTDYDTILNDDTVEAVIELIGGLHPAYEFIRAALQRGKHVVTANKFVLSTYYQELIELAVEHHASLRYTAAVGGGIPWLINLSRAVRLTEVTEIRGIMNGTCNFMLDAMHEKGSEFDTILSVAQQRGFAERDPSADIEGLDTLRKLVLSANIAFQCSVDPNAVAVAGITGIRAQDITVCAAHRRVCRLIAFGKKTEQGPALYVEPAFVQRTSLYGAVKENLNLISFYTELTGWESFYGSGAGRYPTAYTVVEDSLDVAWGEEKAYNERMCPATVHNESICHRYYVHTSCRDSWLDSVTAEAWGDGVLTVPVSVATMHAAATRAKENGQTWFMAGVED